LIIIPDGELAHLPFEVLLTQACAEADMPYADMPFLLRRYAVGYHYAGHLWLSQQQRSAKAKTASSALRVLAMAADYSRPNDSLQARRLSNDWALRLTLKPLKASTEEISAVQAIFAGKSETQHNASEAFFKKLAPQYDILHLALHGIVDEHQAVRSALAFTEDGSATENNFLHAYEISQMSLNARLVVLSACETGYGKIERGNGVASIARAFMYAGVPSLVVSLWSVNDQTTSVLMPLFYEQLAAGDNQLQALQNAKLLYLQHAKGIAAHPAFWSAFIHLGDSRPLPITTQRRYFWWYVGAATLGLLALGFVVWRRKKAA